MGALFALSIGLFLIFEVFAPEIERRRKLASSINRTMNFAKDEVTVNSTVMAAINRLPEGRERDEAMARALADAKKYTRKLA